MDHTYAFALQNQQGVDDDFTHQVFARACLSVEKRKEKELIADCLPASIERGARY